MSPHLRFRFSLIASVVAALACAVATRAENVDTRRVESPPVARTVDVVDHVFGLTLPDPYRWMEGTHNAEFQAWLEAQGKDTRRKLDAVPTLASWRERLKQISGTTPTYRDEQRVADRLFFIREEGSDRGSLMLRQADGRERVLFDPRTLGADTQHPSITRYAVSMDGRHVAINIDRGGNEVTRVQVLDVDSGKFLADAVEPVWGEFSVNWLPDGSGFMYVQMAPEKERAGGDPLTNMRARLHRLGTQPKADRVLLRGGDGEGSNAKFVLQGNEFPIIQASADSRWAIATAGGARPETRVCVAPLAPALEPAAHWRCLIEYADEVQGVDVHENTLYLLSTKDRLNGRLLAIDLSQPDASLAKSRELLPMSDKAIITAIVAARDALYVQRSADGIDGFLRIDYVTGKSTSLDPPLAGSAFLFRGNPALDGFWTVMQSWNAPRTAYAYAPAASTFIDLKLTERSPADYGMIESIETDAISADGTYIPLSILQRKDVKLDGRNRAMVRGYGGYGMSIQPNFNPLLLEWVKAGGVIAVAHVRGGGEKGEAWHRGGQGANKHKGVEDIVGCAAALARLGYTTPQRTALAGGSMGGLLIGGAVVQAPDTFAAAVIQVGILNPVRLYESINGVNQIAEIGDPHNGSDLKAIVAADPYQNIRPSTKYPAVMLALGLNDSRVSPWHSGKFAARLQAATTSGKPVWIDTFADLGHGLNSREAAAAEYADIFAFLDAQLPGR